MKAKTAITGLALTGGLLAGASVARADAYMELISGSTKVQVTGPVGLDGGNFEGVSGNGAIFVGSVGSWSVDIASGGQSGAFNVTLTDNINGSTTQTHGLEVIYSSGSYPLNGNYNFGASDSGGNSLTATVSGWYSSSLYQGTGSKGTSLGSWTLGTTFAQGNENTDIPISGEDYITEEMLFGGTTGSITPQSVTMNATASFTPFVAPPSVADGGWTATMCGSTLLGLVGFSSRSKKRV
ncbi:MAG TPA: hypothetical protein VGO59_07785 [Verrucomicrobiae bacterium]